MEILNEAEEEYSSSDGIGLSTVKALLDRGASIAVCGVNEKNLADLLRSFLWGVKSKHQDYSFQRLDVVDRTQVKAFLHATKTRFGGVDGITNIAGVIGKYFGLKTFWQRAPEEFDFVMNVNVRGAFNFVAEAMTPGSLEGGSRNIRLNAVLPWIPLLG
ncbi:uncharacterized protein A1O5_01337 [Cladophialophora psammophila CBS 110553]|uniref:3-oxoacyl-[acyl-carrier protein] reductase n=1 Tax=Cladophialophora psammophila CBS 110553 TaxID=1182543 RepID=W9XWK4_9EURO|nr:uncharacterized protein A1O5_01337 [Cladophialophora psammophila CBS 110553]EXJ74644.1 hypothetical protein A1O5_01337 [Cladophialophora psammophila CBS 110553]